MTTTNGVPATTTQVTAVAVQSPWLSKVNWTQVVQAAAMILVIATGGKLNIDPTQQAAIVVAIGVIGNALTIIFKTWFTKTVAPQSLSADAVIKTVVTK